MDNTDDCAALNLATDDIEELQSFVHGVAHSSGSQSAELFPRFSRIIMHYQEQPQLLDPVLESLVCPLTKALLSIAFLPAKGDATSVPVLPHTFDRDRLVHTTRFLWQLASVRGYKTIVRFMPNDVAIFEPVVGLLEAVSLPRVSDAIDPGNGHFNAASEATETPASANWEAQYVLLMWLSLLVLIPFDLVLLDSSLGHSVTARDESAAVIAPLGARLIRLSRRFLRCSGPTREMAAVLLGRLVTRRDLEPALSEFADWGSRSLSLKEDDDPQTAFVVPGVALSFATTFKLGDRQAMLPIAARVLHPATQLLSSPSAANNALVRKLCVKLIQRAALCFLPQKTAAWRYQKRHRTLQAAISSPAAGTASAETTTNLELQNTNGDAHVCMSESVNGVVRTYILKESDVDIDNGVGLGGEWVAGVDHAASVESAIESMLCALGDKDTVVRWSAAKGLGRITGRLPRGMADEVVGAVLSSFTDPLGDVATWHGGCLALAELTRRGLLLPERLSHAVPLVVKALQYDVRRGHCSVGANVRDSAAYVCWAVARAYVSSTLGKAVETLAPALITAAVYDREVNCRRAAAAAFQECVGRLGSFPYGIEILTAADYFSVSLRTAAYMQVAPQVASYPGYFAPLAWHLLHVKLHHWDKALRELAATALAGLVELNPAFILQEALPHLFPLCTSSVLETRHGAIAAVAEILPALHAIRDRTAQEDINLPHAIACTIADVLPSIVRLNMGRGKGGEVIRGAVCRLIETISLTGVPLLTHQRACLYSMALENLHHPNETIQRGAASALAAFALHHLDRVMQQQDDRKRAAADNDAEDKLSHTLTVSNLLTRLIDDLRSGQPVHGRRGAALALGALPGCIVKPHEDEVFFSLAAATAIEEDAASRDVETRSYAAQALSRVALSLWSSADFQPHQEHEGRTGAGPGAITLLRDYVLTPLLHAMEDYTVDNRGDVGSRTREAAMRSLHDVLCMLGPHGILHVAQLAEQAFVLTLRQAVERIARVREVAGECLRSLSLVFADAGMAIAPQVAARANACSGESYSGGVAVASFAQLMGAPELQEALLEGMVYSIGGLDAQLSELSAEALIDALSMLSHDDVATVANSFCAVWSKHFKTKRMATPLLTATEVVLSRSELRDLCKESRARDGFAAQLLRFVTGEIQGCTDVFRLHAAAGALCQLAGASCGDIQRESLSAIVTLFGNRFPKVRRYAAEQLYTALLAWDDGEEDVDVDVEGAMDVLTETPWDGDASVVRPARRRLGECLRVSLPEEQSSAAAQARLEEGERAVMEGRRAKAGGYAELLHQLEKGQH